MIVIHTYLQLHAYTYIERPHPRWLWMMAVTVKIQIGRMKMIDQGIGEKVVWERFWEQRTTNSDSAVSTSGNRTKHMPIGHWLLWGQRWSVTSGDLSWPWNAYDAHAISKVTPRHQSHQLTPFKTIAPQVAFLSRFRWNLVGGCSTYDVITSWPDLTWPYFTKSSKKMPHKLWKILARYSKRCDVQVRKTHGGLHHPPSTDEG